MCLTWSLSHPLVLIVPNFVFVSFFFSSFLTLAECHLDHGFHYLSNHFKNRKYVYFIILGNLFAIFFTSLTSSLLSLLLWGYWFSQVWYYLTLTMCDFLLLVFYIFTFFYFLYPSQSAFKIHFLSQIMFIKYLLSIRQWSRCKSNRAE